MERIIDLVAGARPNFMKLAPVVRALKERSGPKFRIVHTGQHYDHGMNDVFFEELGIPKPAVHLEVGSGSHGAQTARVLERYEAHLLAKRPIATVVFGDVNSTAACALAAVKLGIPVLHVEAGLRSFDRSMPEEINRIVTDALADVLFVSEPSGIANLQREGVAQSKMHLVGNVMVDTLVRELPRAEALKTHEKLSLIPRRYGLVTLHRPSNVDDPKTLKTLLELLVSFSERIPLVFPMHPRTAGAVENNRYQHIIERSKDLHCILPLPYRQNLCLMAQAKLVLTDSGGMQEETTFLRVPCLTLRENTERPITVERGTSRLVGNDPTRIQEAFSEVLAGNWPAGDAIPLWDGKTSERIVDIILSCSFE